MNHVNLKQQQHLHYMCEMCMWFLDVTCYVSLIVMYRASVFIFTLFLSARLIYIHVIFTRGACGHFSVLMTLTVIITVIALEILSHSMAKCTITCAHMVTS